MGYRSEVQICLLKENFLELQEKMRNINNEYDKNLMDLKTSNGSLDIYEELTSIDNEKVIVFGWNWIKWYEGFEGYEAIDLVDNYLCELDDKEIPYKFIRLGEEDDDIEIKENYCNGECDRIEFTRAIEII